MYKRASLNVALTLPILTLSLILNLILNACLVALLPLLESPLTTTLPSGTLQNALRPVALQQSPMSLVEYSIVQFGPPPLTCVIPPSPSTFGTHRVSGGTGKAARPKLVDG